MQNKNAVLLFTVLLSLATLYTLSFNWVANNYEEEAANYGAFVADSLESTGEITEDFTNRLNSSFKLVQGTVWGEVSDP